MPPVRALARVTLVLTLLAMLPAGALLPPPARAASQDGDLRVEVITAYNFVVDSNVESPSTYAPQAATIGARFCNDGTNDLTGVLAAVGDYDPNGDANPADSTPGIYPARAHPGLTGPLPGGQFALSHEGGSAGTSDASRSIPRIPAGECRTQYWLVSYPRLDVDGDSVTLGIKPDDDLWLEYDIWATADDAGALRRVDTTRRATMRNEISAAANKIWPNGDNKVPEQYKQAIAAQLGWDTFTPGGGTTAYPGETVTTQGIWYDFGVVGAGFDNDGDLLPDYNAWVQPIGDPSTYDPGCFRLVRTYGIVIVKLVGGGELLIPFEDQLYFEHIPDNTGAVGLVFYEYAALDGACTAAVTPYQEVASGFDNEKFSGDYGVGLPPLRTVEPAFSLAKGVDQPAVGPALPATLRYTISFGNASPVAIGNPDFGVPLVLRDAIPPGTVYDAGSAAASIVLPPGVTARVLYSHDGGATWSTSESPAATVTHLQWWLNDQLPAGATGSVGFSVTVPGAYAQPVVPNTAAAAFGGGPAFAEAEAISLVRGPNSIGGSLFRDDGAVGGVAGNGLRDGGEASLPTVTVSLYYDADGDGQLDDGEPLLATAASAPDGTFSFAGLPDGDFLVVVDQADPDLPDGYRATTRTTFFVNDLGVGSASPVAASGADFGFGPALRVDKRLSSTSPAYEAGLVTYTLDLANTLPGDGTSDGFCRYTVWATVAHPTTGQTPPGGGPVNSQWQNPTSALNGPDGAYAETVMSNNPDVLGLSGFGIGAQPGAITRVEALLHLREKAEFQAGDRFFLRFFHGDAQRGADFTYRGDTYFTLPAGSLYALRQDVTALHPGGASAWTWADFAGNLTEMQVEGNGAGGSPGDVALDAAAYLITTDQRCGGAESTIASLPLTDTFDADLLQFVSASPAPSSVSMSGTAPNSVGTIGWDNVGPLYAGQTRPVTVVFRALDPGATATTTNAVSASGARFGDGKPANDSGDSADVQIVPTGSISGVVWSQVTGGTAGWAGATGYDAGDARVPGVTVTLFGCYSDNPASGGTLITAPNTTRSCDAQSSPANWFAVPGGTQTTDASGSYRFEGLRDGYYYVQVDSASLPAGATQSAEANDTQAPGGHGCPACDHIWGNPAANMTLANFNPIVGNEDIADVNFGYTMNPVVFGTIWSDADGDGVRDAGEPGLDNGASGVNVTLVNCGADTTCGTGDDTTVATVSTDADGAYEFAGAAMVANRRYRITVDTGTLPAGTWAQTGETGPNQDGALDNALQTGILLGGQVSGSHDFGYRASGTSAIGDTLFFDWDGDGAQDAADEGMPNITVRLYRDADSDGSVDPGVDTLVATTATNASGQYSFANLPAGSYIVVPDSADADFRAGLSLTADPDEAGVCATCDGSGGATVDGASADMTLDFGYRPSGAGAVGDTIWLDRNGDGVQSGVQETGIAGVSVVLWADFNGDGVFVQIGSAVTDADGTYRFANLPDASYRVTVNTSDPDLPRDAFGNPYVLATPPTRTATVTGGGADLSADFGFAALGAVGDTIFWDANGDGEQDWNEAGIPGVLVSLYRDVNNDDRYTAGTDTLVGSATTAADGKYLFTGLPAGEYVAVVGAIPGGPALSADPDADGVPCGAPGASGCDGEHDTTVRPGSSYMGADFGYLPPATIGDSLWIDADGDGLRDASESGIPFVTIELVSAGCTQGVNCPTAETDADGFYTFMNVPDGSYTAVVRTADADFPGGLTPTSDADGVANGSTQVVVSGGAVTMVGGSACTSCGLSADFGYRYSGANTLSGTVCLDSAALARVCGAGTSGVGAGQAPFGGVPLYLYLWADDGDGAVEPGETTAIASTTTGASGDYAFANVPDGVYLVVLGAPQTSLALTTQTGDTPAARVTRTPATGDTASAYQVVSAGPAVTNLDFAFAATVSYDYGDLPAPYPTTFGANPAGPRHIISGVPALYLGGAPDAESDGAPSPLADGDGADEDGVTPVNTHLWVDGAGGGAVRVTASGAGWLAGWIDFNGDADFTDAGELVVSRAVSAGTADHSFSIPGGTITGAVRTLRARFRLFAQAPVFPELAYTGTVEGGEVEDYQFVVGSLVQGTVYRDVNANGAYDAGTDTPLSGVDVVITDANGASVTVTTDGAGFFSQVVPAGATVVDVDDADLPVGLSLAAGSSDPTSVSVPVSGIETDNTGYVGALSPIGTIGDRVWEDADGDGVQDAGEIGIAGVTLRLEEAGADGVFGTADDVTGFTPQTTAADGSYSFGTLPAGTYRVTVDAASLPAGVSQTYELDSTLNGSVVVGLADGQVRDEMDFGYRNVPVLTGTLGDRVWQDADGDGVQDAGEGGLAGVTVRLTWAGPDDTFGTGDDTTATATTDVTGGYNFNALPVGRFRVTVDAATLPAGVSQTYELDGTLDGRSEVMLGAGELRSDVDFGYTSGPPAPPTGAVGDRVWLDLDGDGVQDAGEVGIAGAAVDLTYAGADGSFGTGDDVSFAQVTDASGAYSFGALPAGSYRASVRTATLPAGTSATYDLDGGADGSADFSLADGQVRADVDFGFRGGASLGDRVWQDADGDGLQGAGESGIAGVTLRLAQAGPDGSFGTADDLLVATVVTGASGDYTFASLPAGTYQVQVDTGSLPGGIMQTYELDADMDGAVMVALGVGQERTDVDFGYWSSAISPEGFIGDVVWLDLDGDGTQGVGEPGLPGVTVSLTEAGVDGSFGTADDVRSTQATGADGSYRFTRLPGGLYRVQLDTATLPAGLAASYEADGTPDGSVTLMLSPIETRDDVDFGFRGGASLGDRVWDDADGDGVQDTGEGGIAGVTVTLVWAGQDGLPGTGDDLSFAQVTGASGDYGFAGLPAGQYRTQVDQGTLPVGMVATYDLDGGGDSLADIALAAGQSRADVDFGFVVPAVDLQISISDGGVTMRPGGTIVYTLSYTNTGSAGASGVVITEVVPPNSVFSAAASAPGWVCVPDGRAGSTCTFAVGSLAAGASGKLTFAVTVVDPLPVGVTQIANSASIRDDGSRGSDPTPNNNAGAETTVMDPTAIDLVSFMAALEGGALVVRWVTGAEFDTWGFHLYRSADGDRAHAVRVTPQLILGRGRGRGGATYAWTDAGAQPGVTYTYWLQEIELSGGAHEYGPTSGARTAGTGQHRIALPLVRR